MGVYYKVRQHVGGGDRGSRKCRPSRAGAEKLIWTSRPGTSHFACDHKIVGNRGATAWEMARTRRPIDQVMWVVSTAHQPRAVDIISRFASTKLVRRQAAVDNYSSIMRWHSEVRPELEHLRFLALIHAPKPGGGRAHVDARFLGSVLRCPGGRLRSGHGHGRGDVGLPGVKVVGPVGAENLIRRPHAASSHS